MPWALGLAQHLLSSQGSLLVPRQLSDMPFGSQASTALESGGLKWVLVSATQVSC